MLVYQEGNFAKNGKAHEFRETEQNLIRKFKFQKKKDIVDPCRILLYKQFRKYVLSHGTIL